MDIEQFPAFKSLNSTQIANFVSACEASDFDVGTDIIKQGEHGNQMFLLLSGEVRVYLPGATEQELAVIKAPAVLGEMELLTEEPRTASVRATSSVHCLAISFDRLRARLADGDPATLKVIYNVARVLAHRLGAMDRKLGEIESGKAPRSEELHEFKMKLFSEWSF